MNKYIWFNEKENKYFIQQLFTWIYPDSFYLDV